MNEFLNSVKNFYKVFWLCIIFIPSCASHKEFTARIENAAPSALEQNGEITPEKPRFFDDLPTGSVKQASFTSESTLKKPLILGEDDWLVLKDKLLIVIQHTDKLDSFEWNNEATKTNGKITRLDNFGVCQRFIFSVVKHTKDTWFETTLCRKNASNYEIQSIKTWG